MDLASVKLPRLESLVFIAVQAFTVAQLGLHLGSRVTEGVREGAEKLAGVALIGVGLVLLVQTLIG